MLFADSPSMAASPNPCGLRISSPAESPRARAGDGHRSLPAISIRRGHISLLLAEQDPRVHGLTGARNHLKIHLITNRLEEHEGHVPVKGFLCQRRPFLNVATS